MQFQLYENGYIRASAESGLANPIIYDGEIPEGFTKNQGYYKLENGQLVFDADKQKQHQDREALEAERAEIESWFSWYDIEVNKWQRGQRTGVPRTDIDIAALDTEADEKRQRLKEILAELYGQD